MDEAQIYTLLTKIFEEVFDEGPIRVTPELSATEVDGWDSLGHIRLILMIEKVFNIKFAIEDMGKMVLVGDLAAVIKAQVACKPGKEAV